MPNQLTHLFKAEFVRPPKSTANQVIYCPVCFSPIVNSYEGRSGHFERLGHRVEERKQ